MRRFSLLLAGGALWLFLTAVPALADGGPHLTSVNSGTSTLTADSCAGCHRAHTAQSEFLLAAASEELLCLSCHGNAGTLATVNVENGVQYVPDEADGTRTGTVLGALRNGGFLQARIDSSDPTRLSYIRGYEDSPFNTVYAISQKPKVGVLGTSLDVNSAHIDLNGGAADGIADTGTVWGKGALNSGDGTPLVELTCVECHNPHGNGNYRILRPVPGVEADPLGQPLPVDVKATYANFSTIVTDGQHGLVVGDEVSLAGVGGLTDGTYYVGTVTNGFTFKVAASLTTLGTSLAVTNTTDTGTVTRPEIPIADVSTDPDGNPGNGIENPTKNYTVLQTKGSQGVDSTYLLYARDVLAALAGTGVADDQDPVTIDQTIAITSSSGTTTYWFQTLGAHGLAVGDLVDLAGGPWGLTLSNPYTVANVGNAASSITSLSAGGTFTTSDPVGYVVGETVTILGPIAITGYPAGDYVIDTAPSLTTFTLTTGTPGTAQTFPSGGQPTVTSTVYDRFTVVGATFVNDTTDGSVVRKGIPGTYDATGGDYFRRIVPWNASLINDNCDNEAFSTANSAYCGSANDAPNGRPNAISSGPSSLLGQQAFLDQISTWCSQCHTRYYSASNENVAGDPPISVISDRPIGRTRGGTNDQIFPMYYTPSATQYGGPSYGDRVTFAGTGTGLDSNPAGGWYVISTGTASGRSWFKVSATQAGAPFDLADAGTAPYDTSIGTFTRVYQSSNSSWGYPREDDTYKYQHSTASNRACVVCHVSHGSNAEMIGPDSLAVPYPDGTTTSTSSRLLKVDNRGTCQMCHDPTGTIVEGTYLPPVGYSTTVP